jgi:hypothetical protein
VLIQITTKTNNPPLIPLDDGDLVRCFQCGIGLKDFSQNDDPLLEHVRHSEKCPFIPQLLGEQRLASIKVSFEVKINKFKFAVLCKINVFCILTIHDQNQN